MAGARQLHEVSPRNSRANLGHGTADPVPVGRAGIAADEVDALPYPGQALPGIGVPMHGEDRAFDRRRTAKDTAAGGVGPERRPAMSRQHLRHEGAKHAAAREIGAERLGTLPSLLPPGRAADQPLLLFDRRDRKST